jgi:hypothetical protein
MNFNEIRNGHLGVYDSCLQATLSKNDGISLDVRRRCLIQLRNDIENQAYVRISSWILLKWRLG